MTEGQRRALLAAVLAGSFTLSIEALAVTFNWAGIHLDAASLIIFILGPAALILMIQKLVRDGTGSRSEPSERSAHGQPLLGSYRAQAFLAGTVGFVLIAAVSPVLRLGLGMPEWTALLIALAIGGAVFIGILNHGGGIDWSHWR